MSSKASVLAACAGVCILVAALSWPATSSTTLPVLHPSGTLSTSQANGMSIGRAPSSGSATRINQPRMQPLYNAREADYIVPSAAGFQLNTTLLAGIVSAVTGAIVFSLGQAIRSWNSSTNEKTPLTAMDIHLEPSWNMTTVAVEKETQVPFQDVFESFRTGYTSVTADTQAEGWLQCIQGEVPKELTGTLFRNGPALFERNGQAREYLDGDGLVSQVAVKDGKVHFRSRFVATDSFKREQAAGKFTDLAIFTTSDPRPELLGGPMWMYRLWDDMFNGPPNPKANAAYNALHWAGKTMAIDWGRPWALDPHTLDVIDDGKVDEMSQVKYTAHYRILEGKDGHSTIVFFNPATDWAKQKTTVTFYEFDDKGKKLQTKVVEFPATYFHDLIVTDNYYVLFDCPIKMDYRKAFIGYPMGQNSLGDTVSEDLSKKPIFRIYPRHSDGEILIEAPELCYAFHHVNGFDDGKRLVFDTCTWDRFSLYFTDIVKPDGKELFPKTKMSRFVIDLDSKTCTRSIIHETPCEYPVVSPSATGKPYRYGYMCTSAVKHESGVNGPLQSITKVTFSDISVDCKQATLESWVPGKYMFSMEPVFAPRPNPKSEDDGWILALIHDGTPGQKGTNFVILDALNIAAGPVATLRLPHYVPIGVHGSFTPDYLGPATV